MAKLVLVRHGLSALNKTGQWTGWVDPDLAPEGEEQAKVAGQDLKDIQFDYTYANILRRCRQTLAIVKKEIGQEVIPTILSWELNERNYGDYTLKNKWQVKEEVGEETFQQIRRSWDFPIPNGESLKQVSERAIPYYDEAIIPQLKAGKNVLIVSSGNALRALVKHIEGIPDDKIGDLEIGTGEVYVYDIDSEGNMTNKEVRASNPNKGKV
jgi:2,3-bisphosphoglycerate-dependent phosphoglycerate mutase